MEIVRWIKDFKFAAGDPENVRCRLVVQQYKDFVSKRHASGNSTSVDVEIVAQFGSVQTAERQERNHTPGAQLWHSFTTFYPGR